MWNLQEDSFWPRAVRTAGVREEEATGHQQEREDEDRAQTGQDPLRAPRQVDEMQLRRRNRTGYPCGATIHTAVFVKSQQM